MDNDQELKEYIDKLPSELKQAIFSIDYQKQLQEVARRNKLLIDQAGKLEAETTLVMAGMEPLKDYIANLIKNVELSRDKAIIVAHDVDELIFKNIREELRKINEEDEKEEKKEEEDLTKEKILEGIENPSSLDGASISVNTLGSNLAQKTEPAVKSSEKVEIRKEILAEIKPQPVVKIETMPVVDANLPAKISMNNLPMTQSPVKNIVQTKTTQEVIVPKQQITIEEKTKLPEKPRSTDPYREAIM